MPSKLAALIRPLTPKPPVITAVPVVVDVDAVPAVNVVAPLDDSVVNAPVDAVDAPTVVPFILPPLIVADVIVKDEAVLPLCSLSVFRLVKLESTSVHVSGLPLPTRVTIVDIYFPFYLSFSNLR
jgi:hypothetical protein